MQQMAGIATLDGIASALNARGVRTDRGGAWHPIPSGTCSPASLLKPFKRAHACLMCGSDHAQVNRGN